MTEIDFSTLGVYERYKLMASLIVPRPIALVTTLSEDGTVNASCGPAVPGLTHSAFSANSLRHGIDGVSSVSGFGVAAVCPNKERGWAVTAGVPFSSSQPFGTLSTFSSYQRGRA